MVYCSSQVWLLVASVWCNIISHNLGSFTRLFWHIFVLIDVSCKMRIIMFVLVWIPIVVNCKLRNATQQISKTNIGVIIYQNTASTDGTFIFLSQNCKLDNQLLVWFAGYVFLGCANYMFSILFGFLFVALRKLQ